MDYWESSKRLSDFYYQVRSLAGHRFEREVFELKRDNVKRKNNIIAAIFSAIVVTSMATMENNEGNNISKLLLTEVVDNQWLETLMFILLPIAIGLLFLGLYQLSRIVSNWMNDEAFNFEPSDPYENMPEEFKEEDLWFNYYRYKVFHPLASAASMIDTLPEPTKDPQNEIAPKHRFVLREASELFKASMHSLGYVGSIKPHLRDSADNEQLTQEKIAELGDNAQRLLRVITKHWKSDSEENDHSREIYELNHKYNEARGAISKGFNL